MYFLIDIKLASFMKVPKVPVKALSKKRRAGAKLMGQPTNPLTRGLAAKMLKESRKFQKKYNLTEGLSKSAKRRSTYINAAHDLEHQTLLKKGLPATPRDMGEIHMDTGFDSGLGRSGYKGKVPEQAIQARIKERKAKGLAPLKEKELRYRAEKMNERFKEEGRELSRDYRTKYYAKADKYLSRKGDKMKG